MLLAPSKSRPHPELKEQEQEPCAAVVQSCVGTTPASRALQVADASKSSNGPKLTFVATQLNWDAAPPAHHVPCGHAVPAAVELPTGHDYPGVAAHATGGAEPPTQYNETGQATPGAVTPLPAAQ